ncbi:MAG TPA: MarR family transcriptional regulator [Thermomicrobiales bacterium]|jgi:DNA-binding MarR family transcriptional regulator
MGNGTSTETVDGERTMAAEEADESLREVLTRWNRMFWWSGVRPMLQRMVTADLTLAESIVLRSLRRGPLTVAEAAACLMLSHSAASRAVDRLVRDGYVRREENPDDRRQKLLTLAPQGMALVGEMEGIAIDRLERMADVLNDDEREQFRALMAQMLVRHATHLARQHGQTGCFGGPIALEDAAAADIDVGDHG